MIKKRFDYSDMAWRTITGDVVFWRDLEDRHLANIYGYFQSSPERKKSFSRRHPGALTWLKQEAKRRGISHLIRSVLQYGPYPYFDTKHQQWMVYDADARTLVAVSDYDMDRIPPDARDEIVVRKLLTGGRRRNARRGDRYRLMVL
jgi:hypothetical protein